jgi:hypothetical protein
MLIDTAKNFAVLGGTPHAHSATLEEIEEYLSG